MKKGKFALGKFVATRNALESLNGEDIKIALTRHSNGGLTSWRSPGQIDSMRCSLGLELEFVLVSQWAELTL